MWHSYCICAWYSEFVIVHAAELGETPSERVTVMRCVDIDKPDTPDT